MPTERTNLITDRSSNNSTVRRTAMPSTPNVAADSMKETKQPQQRTSTLAPLAESAYRDPAQGIAGEDYGSSQPHGSDDGEKTSLLAQENAVAVKPPPLGAFGLFALLYSFSCGSGYGFEDAVGGGKALPITMFCLLVPWIWCLPTALAVSELSTMLPSNAGFLLWSDVTMPKQLTMFNVFTSGIGNFISTAAFPSLFAQYVNTYFYDEDQAVRLGSVNLSAMPSKIAIVIFCAGMNIVGVDVVGGAALFLSAFVTLPFIFMFIIQAAGPLWMSETTAAAIGMGAAAAANITGTSNAVNATNATAELWLQPGIDWKTIGFANNWDVNWATYLSIGSWNYGGYDAAGQVCEEVADPQKTLLRAFIPLMFSTYVAYLLPVWAGVSVFKAGSGQDWSKWTAGYWPTVGGYIAQGKWLEQYTRAGAVATGIGYTISAITCGARLLAGIGQIGALPKRASEFLSAYHPRFRTPVNAIVILSIVTIIFSCLVPFDQIVGVGQSIYMLRMLTIYWAVVYMRKHHPQLARPFKIPLSDRSVVALMIPAAIFSAAVMICSVLGDTLTIAAGVVFYSVGAVVAYLMVRFELFSGVQNAAGVAAEQGSAVDAAAFLPRGSFAERPSDCAIADGDGQDENDNSAAENNNDDNNNSDADGKQPPIRSSVAGTAISTTTIEHERNGQSSVTGGDN